MICKITVNKKKIFAFIFALSPILSLYKIPFLEMNMCFVTYWILMLYSVFMNCVKGVYKDNKAKSIIWLMTIIMFLYIIITYFRKSPEEIISDNTSNFFNIVSFLMFITFMALTFYDWKIQRYYINYVKDVAIIMSICVVLQYVLYYIFKFDFNNDRGFLLPMRSLVLDSQHYLDVSLMVYNGLFRPSALFLEPAHFAQYCSIGLACLLLEEEKRVNGKTILVSAGIIMTTSGIGVLTVIFLWLYIYLINMDTVSQKKMVETVGGILFVLVVFVILIFSSDFFIQTMNRLLPSQGGTAIKGRIWSIKYVMDLTGLDRVWGMGYKNIPMNYSTGYQIYMTAIVEMLYCQGIVGTLLFVLLYMQMMLKAHLYKEKRCMMILVLIVPYILGTSFLQMMTIGQYIPFLYIRRNKEIEVNEERDEKDRKRGAA